MAEPESASPKADPRTIDVRAVISALRAGNAPEAWLSRWVPTAYADPAVFLEMLYSHAAKRRGGLASDVSRAFDFYKDCVVSHLGESRKALSIQKTGREVSLTYDDLHARSSALMTSWRAAGAAPGMSVCILLPIGVEYTVALMTALRMGLVVATVPPSGPSFARNRLTDLAPDGVVASDRFVPLVRSLDLAVWPLLGAREAGPVGTHAYSAKDPVLRAWPAYGSEEDGFVEISAAQLHAGLIRDALLVFALDPKDVVALPGIDPLIAQPTTLLSTLLGGARFADLSVSDVVNQKDVLDQAGVTVLGVDKTLREAILARGAWPKSDLRMWFRLMTDPLDMPRWEAFGKLGADAGVASMSTAISAASGGALLLSPVVKEAPGLSVWPLPGQPFELFEMGTDGLPALNDSGIVSPMFGEDPVLGAPKLLLSRGENGYLCSGSVDLGPCARAYPIAEVSAVVEAHPAVRYATVIVSAGRTINDAHVTLIAFIEDIPEKGKESAQAVTVSELKKLVTTEMGPAFTPSRVEIFPLRPRVVDGAIDRAHCRSQYLSGALSKKARNEMFLLLSRLGYLLEVE